MARVSQNGYVPPGEGWARWAESSKAFRQPLGNFPSIRSIVTKALGSVYLLSQLLEALGVDPVVDEYAPMGRGSGQLTHGDVIQLSVQPGEWRRVELNGEGSRCSQDAGVAERTLGVTMPNPQQEGSFEVNGETLQAVRLVLVKSRQKGQRQRQTRHRHIRKLLEKLTEWQEKLNTRRYKKRDEVPQRIEAFFREELSRYRPLFDIQISGEGRRCFRASLVAKSGSLASDLKAGQPLPPCNGPAGVRHRFSPGRL